MVNLSIFFEPKSLLATMTLTSFLATLFGRAASATLPAMAKPVLAISQPVFIICFTIWLGFVGLTLVRQF